MKLSRRLLWQVNRSPLRHAVKAARGIGARAERAERTHLLSQLPHDPEIVAAAASIGDKGFATVASLIEPAAFQELQRAVDVADPLSARGKVSDVFGGNKTLWTHLIESAMRDGRLDADNAFAQFALQPRVIAAIARVLGGVPRLDYVTVTHSLPTQRAPEFSQLWHRDYDDVRVLKLFVYLTDVLDERDGPFTFIPARTSRRFGYRFRSHLSDEEVARRINLETDVVRMTGPAASAFIVETSRCLHMGSRVAPGHERLMYTATYFLPPRIFAEPEPPFFRPTGGESAIEQRLLTP